MAFVQRASRLWLSDGQERALQALGSSLSGSDWEDAQQFATAEGVAPLTFTAASASGLLPVMPPKVAARLAATYRQTLVDNQRTEKIQHAALRELASSHVAAIPLKGVALAARLYGELALRPVGDIDLLVPRPDLNAARRALERAGYRAARGGGSAFDFAALVSRDLTLEREGGPTLEMHWALTHQPAYRNALPIDQIWARSRVVQQRGLSVRCLAPEDELRYLCLHFAADHQAGRLIWLVDIVELIRAESAAWSWTQFVEGTVASRMAAPVALALRQGVERLDLELPDGVLPALERAAEARSERAAWKTVGSDLLSGVGIWAHVAALRSPIELAVFLRGLFVPGPTRIRHLYGRTNARGLRLMRLYVTHWRRLARRLSEALPIGTPRRRSAG